MGPNYIRIWPDPDKTLLAIPVDVLREILEHVDIADLATLCRVICSCSQDVLYRDKSYPKESVIQTLAKSTDLARRVRSFKTTRLTPS
jgi:F-box domain